MAVHLHLHLRLGRGRSRIALALTLGVFGTLSPVMGPIQWLLDGNSLGRAVSDAEAMMFVFAAGGIPHLAAVLAAMALMFGPTANAYFRSARGR